MIPTIATIAVLVQLLGIGVLTANPYRATNRTVFAFNTLATIWLLCVYGVVEAFERACAGDSTADPMFWHRANAGVAAFVPVSLWLVRESVLGKITGTIAFVRSAAPWTILAVVLAGLSLEKSFVHPIEPPDWPKRGASYFVYSIILLTSALTFFVYSIRKTQQEAGIRRLEMQFIVLPSGATAILIVSVNTLGSLLGEKQITQVSPILALVGNSIVAWGLATYRVFDVRHVARLAAQKTSVAGVLVSTALAVSALLPEQTVPSISTSLAALVGGVLAFWWDRFSSNRLSVSMPSQIARLRELVVAESRYETDPDILAAKFRRLLEPLFRTPAVEFWFEQNSGLASGDRVLARNRPATAALRSLGWATPDSLQRRRPNPHSDDLKDFLGTNEIGLAVVAPSGTTNPPFMITFRVRTDAWPFTFPEVERLLIVTELVAGILARARLASQAALEARMAHLALMSRGLAHDLKNLITPIDSFLVHTEGRFAPDTPEGEVHRDAHRSVRLMTDYVREAHFFSSRLQPRLELIAVTALLKQVIDAVRTVATSRGIALHLSATGEIPLVGDRILLLRLLINLAQNALDASTTGSSVTLRATSTPADAVRFEVVDTGSGISPEHLPRVFEPFFTTKQFGHEIRGFGLGLAIVEKIAHLHQGTVRLTSTVGQGTTVTVELPSVPTPGALSPAPSA